MGASLVLDKYYLDSTLYCVSRGLCPGDDKNNCGNLKEKSLLTGIQINCI
jgi:hypothetical protein